MSKLESLGVPTEEQIQAKLVVDRSKFWTPDLQKLLRRWQRQISKRQRGHRAAERKYSRLYYGLGIPAAIFAAIIATGIFSSLSATDPPSTTNSTLSLNESSSSTTSSWVLRLVMGIISILSVILTTIVTYLDAGGSREKHKGASDTYQELGRQIDSILRMPITLRGDPFTTVQDIRNKFDGTVKDSPSIPMEFEASLKYRIAKNRRGLRAPKPEDITDYQDTSKLAKLLIDDVEGHKIADRAIKDNIAEENDYDTDEEDREVMIEFDPDMVRPEEILVERQRLTVQESLIKAMEFELKRLNDGKDSKGDPDPSSKSSDKVETLAPILPNEGVEEL